MTHSFSGRRSKQSSPDLGQQILLPLAGATNVEQSAALLFQTSALSDLDRHFARFIERLAGGTHPHLRLAAALVSRSRAQGHTCLELPAVAGTLFPQDAAEEQTRVTLPPWSEWQARLRETAVVGGPHDHTPLVLDGRDRLYLRRYWDYEWSLAAAIRQRAQAILDDVDATQLRASSERLFGPQAAAKELDGQQLAAVTAVRKHLCLITGGPGTGKTRSVAMVVALLLEQARGRPWRIALAAPTGKAAVRMQESVRRLRPQVPCSEAVRALIPDQAVTLHRLLGFRPDSNQPKYTENNPLPFDVVIVDEATMVDLALMTKLFRALPPQARLILLGDKDQLASVEPGAVFGDICSGQDPANPLAGCIVSLQKNYRSGANREISALTAAIALGDASDARQVFEQNIAADAPIRWQPLPAPGELKHSLRPIILQRFTEIRERATPAEALQALERFRILGALRHGPYGVETFNRLAEEILADAGLRASNDPWYAARPLMITSNNYGLRLFNGDTGIVRTDESAGTPLAWFSSEQGEPRSISPLRLPPHETAFAQTVHKSQGSEFDEVLLILPNRDLPVLTRELIYTALTRARTRVQVWSDEDIFSAALARTVQRMSGLKDALWPPAPVPSEGR